MLLPSALPCDLFSAPIERLQRPKLTSFDSFKAASQVPHSTASGILASCRALQSILGGHSTFTTQQGQSDAQLLSHSSLVEPCLLRPPPQLSKAPRGLHKRSRTEFEDDARAMHDTSLLVQHKGGLYQTPKRRRRVPSDLPLGLTASDFDSLNTPQSLRGDQNEDIEMPPLLVESPPQTTKITPSQTQIRRDSNKENILEDPQTTTTPQINSQECWSPIDDRRLVEAVLSKLNLSKRDWNDCAKQLGKDKDSLGRRWKLLVGEGNIGLRRGTGRMHERTNLDIKSW